MSTSASAPAKKRSPFGDFIERAGMLLVLAILFIGCSLFVENFFSWPNMKGLALAVSTTGIVACTMLFCLAAGDFDLSIGAVTACSGVVAALVMNKTESITIGILAGLGCGAVSGLLNGYVVAQLKINALITTLATMQMVRGFTLIVSNYSAVGIVNEDFFLLGNSKVMGLDTPVFIMLVCFAFFGFLLNRTVFGRNTLAVGGNTEAAHLAGIAVERVKIIVFTMQGVIAAFAGIIMASKFTSGQPNTGQGFELDVISACVLGGVSLTGGVGSMGFVIAGVLIMGIIQNAMNLLVISPGYQYVVRGAILLTAVLFDRWKTRGQRR